MSNTLGFGLDVNRGGAGYKYQSETVTLLRALTGTYSTPRKIQIDKLIKSLKTAGIWSKLDVLQMYAAPTAADAVVNWKSPGTFNATLVNSPTLEVDRGITGDGVSSYVNTGFTPSTAGGNFTLNSATFGNYIRNNITNKSHGTRIGSTKYVTINFRNGANELFGRINDTSDIPIILSVTTSVGFTVFSRTGASAKAIYKNGSSIGTGTAASSELLDSAIFVGAFNNNGTISYSTLQTAVNVIGGGLSVDENSSLFTALETYLDYIGAGVI